MRDPMTGPTARDPVWYSETDGDLAAFTATLPDRTAAADWPMAARIVQHVLIYDGAAIGGLDPAGRAALMTEWARAFLDGPGVVVIRGAIPDTAVVNRATAVFERLIAEQRETGGGGGDHFATAGANDRVWNALQKHCMADPEGFALYFGNLPMALAARAWLGPNYQFTAQVNRVNPGGAAQSPHRDYHLGFMSADHAARFPAHVHRLSPALTLQGGIAHCDMPVASGPTMLLPYSQRWPPGYLAFGRPEFRAWFMQHHAQLPLATGDAVFFNPALMHCAGENRTDNINRMVNLLQISSAFGRPIEAVNRLAMARALYGPLATLRASGRLSADESAAAIAACAEGYAFPTNLDSDPPAGGLAPASQAEIMQAALDAAESETEFAAKLTAWAARRLP